MAERIASGEVYIEVNDRDAIARLNKVRAEYHSAMAAIDREQAEAKISADIGEFESEVKRARAELKRLEGAKAEIEMGIREGDLAAVKAKIKDAKRNVKSLDGMKAEIEIEVQGEREALAAQKRMQEATRKRLKEEEKLQRAEEKIANDAHRANMRRVSELNRLSDRMNKQRMRELSTAEKQAYQMERERNEVPKLEAAYNRLIGKLERLGQAKKKISDDHSRSLIEFDERATVNEIERIRSEVHRRVGRDPLMLPMRIEPGRDLGARLRHEMLKHGTWTGVGAAIGTSLGRSIVDSMGRVTQRGFRRSVLGAGRGIASNIGRSVSGNISHGIGKVGDVLGNLSNMTVRLGPFTATIRQLGLALSVLGPTILDLVGSLGALVGVLGAGVAGAATLGAGALVGFGGAALGLLFSMRNTRQEITNARTAINALQKAQEKYGKNSDKAKAKQKELNNTLANISPLAAATAQGIEKFYSNWDKHTATTRKNLGTIATEGFRALNDVTPMWAKFTNSMSTTLSKGMSSAFRFLGRGPGRNILQDIFGNFNQMLPTLLHGFGQFGQSFLNFAREGSKYLPMLARGFDSMGQKLLAFTQRDNFGTKVRGWINMARDLMRFFGAAGRVIMHFFGAGAAAGDQMVNTMTNALNRWDAFLTSAGGRNHMADFFKNSVHGAEALWHALAPIASTFVNWAANLSPVITGFLKGAGAVSNFVGEIIKLVGLQGGIGTLAATLGALWSISKISSATRALAGFTSGLLGVQRAQAAVATAQGERAAATGAANVVGAVGGVGVARNAAGTAAAVERTAGAMSKGARAAGALRTGLSGVGSVLGFANPYFGAAALGVGALAGAYYLLTKRSRDAKQALSNATAATQRSADAQQQNAAASGDVASQYQRSIIAVRQAREELKHAKKGTDDYRLAQLDLHDAMRQRAIDELAQKNTLRENIRLSGQTASRANDEVKAWDKVHGARMRVLKASIAQDKNTPYEGSDQDLHEKAELAKLEGERAQKVRELEKAMNAANAATIVNQRAIAGMIPLTAAATEKLGALAKISKSAAVKVGMKFENPGKVAASAANALKSGVPNRIVLKIIADSKNAEDAVRRLNAARITGKKMTILQEGGRQAVAMLQNIAGRKLTPKEQQIAQRGGPGVLALLAAIAGRKLPNKQFQAILRDLASGKLATILGLINSLPATRNTTITTTYVTRGSAPGALPHGAVVGHASGVAAGHAHPALVGEGRAPEILADHVTGRVARIDQPMFVNLPDSVSVIPTEGAYRQRGRRFFEQFARDMGIPGFKKGTGRRKTHALGKNVEKLKPVKNYRQLQDREDQQTSEATVLNRQLREPDSFLKQVGTDATGTPLYEVDTAAQAAYTKRLTALRDKQANIETTLGKLKEAFAPAVNAIDAYETARRNNIKALQHNLGIDNKLKNSKNKAIKKAAEKRIAKEQKNLGIEQGMLTDAQTVRSDIAQDHKDVVRNRLPLAHEDVVDTNNTLAALPGQIADALASANPSVSYTPGELAIAKGEADLATAGLTASTADDIAATNELLTAQNTRLAEGQAMLKDSNPANDVEAYGIIASASGAIKDLTTQLGQMPGSPQYAAAQQQAFGSAVSSLMSGFGNNFATVQGAAVTRAFGRGVGGGFGSNPAMAAGGGKIVQVMPGAIQQDYHQLPDPHTMSKSLQWELQAL